MQGLEYQRDRIKTKFIEKENISFMMLGRNKSLQRPHGFCPQTQDALKSTFYRLAFGGDEMDDDSSKVINLSDFAKAARNVFKCPELFLTDKSLEFVFERMRQFKHEISFEQFLSLLAVFTKGDLEQRINAFIDCHDMKNKGYIGNIQGVRTNMFQFLKVILQR